MTEPMSAPAECICGNRAVQSYDGPQEDCPVHGRVVVAPADGQTWETWTKEFRPGMGLYVIVADGGRIVAMGLLEKDADVALRDHDAAATVARLEAALAGSEREWRNWHEEQTKALRAALDEIVDVCDLWAAETAGTEFAGITLGETIGEMAAKALGL